jgi:sugar fermentation stimulation protein A
MTIEFHPPLVAGRLVKRYKRFLADVLMQDGQVVTVHCPNTGSMLGLNRPGMQVWLGSSRNPRRKYSWTWELAEPQPGVLVGINTGRSNALVGDALDRGLIAELDRFTAVQREVREGDSRLDFLLSSPDRDARCFLEVKNVTTAGGDAGIAQFPDAVSERASRHLRELIRLKAQGHRCALVYCVQRQDVSTVCPAWEIDPEYSLTLETASRAGVEIYALGASVSPSQLRLERRLEVRLR